MTLEHLLTDKKIKAKEKSVTLRRWLLDGSLSIDEFIASIAKLDHSLKATCIEAIEYATKQNPQIVDANVFAFISQMLLETAPRVKWESARVIANTAHLFPGKLEGCIANLLVNANHNGTVVRWATAFALAEIMKLKTKHNEYLLPEISAICSKEKESSITKKYSDALRKISK
jgi:hypothetical protein